MAQTRVSEHDWGCKNISTLVKVKGANMKNPFWHSNSESKKGKFSDQRVSVTFYVHERPDRMGNLYIYVIFVTCRGRA